MFIISSRISLYLSSGGITVHFIPTNVGCFTPNKFGALRNGEFVLALRQLVIHERRIVKLPSAGTINIPTSMGCTRNHVFNEISMSRGINEVYLVTVGVGVITGNCYTVLFLLFVCPYKRQMQKTLLTISLILKFFHFSFIDTPKSKINLPVSLPESTCPR